MTRPWWSYLVIVGGAGLVRKLVSSLTVSWHRRQKAARLRGQEPKGEMMLLNSLPMVPAPSSALARTGSQALAMRGLRDLDAADNAFHTAGGKCCPENQARLLFCLDHQCTHDRCPDVQHLDFALISVENLRPAVLKPLVQEGWAGEEYYYVLQDRTDWLVMKDSEVGWQPESHPDGMLLLRTPERLRGLLRGHFFSKNEAEKFAEEGRRGNHNQVVRLPRIVPHVWTGPDDVAHGSPPGCSFCGESDPAQYGKACPKRSCDTWYEILGVAERADENQIESAYRKRVKEWDPNRLQYRDDILFDGGYSETQMKWFSSAYAVLSDPVKRQGYDTELLRQRRQNPIDLPQTSS